MTRTAISRLLVLDQVTNAAYFVSAARAATKRPLTQVRAPAADENTEAGKQRGREERERETFQVDLSAASWEMHFRIYAANKSVGRRRIYIFHIPRGSDDLRRENCLRPSLNHFSYAWFGVARAAA